MEESTERRRRRQEPSNNKRSRTNDDGIVAPTSRDVGADGGMTRSRSRSRPDDDDDDDGVDVDDECDEYDECDDECEYDASSVLHPISPLVLSRSDEWSSSYAKNSPYPHGIIPRFCRAGFLENVVCELKRHTRVTFKETDLFRVYQSIDLGCHLLCHDDVIGTRAISYILYLTDVEPKWIDEYGGRLELYDAVPDDGGGGGEGGAGTEAESDDDDDDDDDYKRRRRRWVPSALPSRTILPEFNTLAYFAVRPGVSFHSVQEVFVPDRPRLSIQGWYHARDVPFDVEDATLRRLKSIGRGEDTEGDFVPMLPDDAAIAASKHYASDDRREDEDDDDDGDEDGTNDVLSPADVSFLGRYINATYLTGGSMDTIRERFEEESSVKLRHFLTDEWNDIVSASASRDDERDMLGNDRPALDYSVGTTSDANWHVVGPAHKQRFLEYDSAVPDDDARDGNESVDTSPKKDNGQISRMRTTGESLRHLRSVVFQSGAFGRWLGSVTSLGPPLGHRGRIRRFRPGLDYTVAHHGILTRDSVLDATLCFCAGDGKQCAYDEETNDLIGSDDDAIWESGDVGGFECYIAAVDDCADDGKDGGGGPDDEYDEEDDTKLLSVSASNNTLSLVYRDPGTMRFVKYVSAGAPSSRWDIALEYEMNSTDDADSDEQDDE